MRSSTSAAKAHEIASAMRIVRECGVYLIRTRECHVKRDVMRTCDDTNSYNKAQFGDMSALWSIEITVKI